MNILENLLVEQTKTGNVANTRPFLVQLQKTVAQRVFRDMVAIQETYNPQAQIFGLKYLTNNNKTVHDNSITVTGVQQEGSIASLPQLSQGLSITKDKVYRSKDSDAVYIAIKQTQLPTESNEELLILKQVINGSIRLYQDAANVDYHENRVPEEAKFEIGKWVVPCRTRKISMNVTQELVQDLEQNNLDSAAIIEDTLAQILVNEVNKDIISKLITVSTRFHNPKLGITDGFVDLSTRNDPLWQIGRDINALIGAAAAKMLTDTTYSATYVVVSPDVYGLLCGAGLVVFNQESEMTRSHGYLKSGLKIYIDTYSKFDYFMVGCKHNMDIFEDEDDTDNDTHNENLIGSLYYCPYLEEDGNSIYVTRDSQNMQNNILLQTRYALSVNPFTIDNEKVNIGDDWNNLVGKSKLSVITGIKLK